MESSEQEFLRLVASNEARIKSELSSKARDEFDTARLELDKLRQQIRKLGLLRAIPESIFIGSVLFVLISIFPRQWGLFVIILGVASTIYLQVYYQAWLEKERMLRQRMDEALSSLMKSGEAAWIEAMMQSRPLKPKNSFSVLGVKLKDKRGPE